MDLIHAGSEVVTSDSAFFREPRQRAWTIVPPSPTTAVHSQPMSKVPQSVGNNQEAQEADTLSGGTQSSTTHLDARREVRRGKTMERRMSSV